MSFSDDLCNEVKDINNSLKKLKKEYFRKISQYSIFAAENINKNILPALVIDVNTKEVFSRTFMREKLIQNFLDYVGSDGVIYLKKVINEERKISYIHITYKQFKEIKNSNSNKNLYFISSKCETYIIHPDGNCTHKLENTNIYEFDYRKYIDNGILYFYEDNDNGKLKKYVCTKEIFLKRAKELNCQWIELMKLSIFDDE